MICKLCTYFLDYSLISIENFETFWKCEESILLWCDSCFLWSICTIPVTDRIIINFPREDRNFYSTQLLNSWNSLWMLINSSNSCRGVRKCEQRSFPKIEKYVNIKNGGLGVLNLPSIWSLCLRNPIYVKFFYVFRARLGQEPLKKIKFFRKQCISKFSENL